MGYYSLGDSTIKRILQYDLPERKRITRTNKPRESLNTQEIRDVIEYISTNHSTRVLDYPQIKYELNLSYSTKTLSRRLKEAGYYSCICCQKPYLIKAQANARWL